MALEGWGWRPGDCWDPAELQASPGPEARPARGVRVDAERLAERPAGDRAPGRGQLRPDVRRQLDPRDGPVGLGKIGGGDARGVRGPAQRPRAGAATTGPRSQSIAARGSARTRTRSMRSGASCGSRLRRGAGTWPWPARGAAVRARL